MCRNNLALEILAMALVVIAGVTAFVVVPMPWVMAVPVAACCMVNTALMGYLSFVR